MTQETVVRVGKIFGPIAIHFLVMNMVQMIGLHVDAAFLSTVAALIVLPVFIKMMKQDQRYEARTHLRLVSGLQIVIIALACNFIMTYLLNCLYQYLPLSNEVQESLFDSNLAIQLVGIGIIVPITEEVLFRGLVYQRLKDYNNSWLSAGIASIIFAAYHGNVVQALFAFPMSLIIILVFEKFQTMKAPILFHITVNLSSVIVTALGIG